MRAARRKVPVGIVAAVDAQLRAHGAGGRLDEVLDELDRVRARGRLAAARRADRADRRLAGARQRARREPLRDDRRRAARARQRPLRPHARADRPGARAGGRAARRRRRRRRADVDLEALRDEREGPRGERGGAAPARALRRARRSRCCGRSASAPSGEERSRAPGVDQSREERIREVVRIVQESGIDEITVEEDGMRVQRPPHARAAGVSRAGAPRRRSRRASSSAGDPAARTAWSASRARWSAPSTAAPGRARRRSSRRATRSSPGQTLCILEAMKLMNEVKAEIEGDRPEDPRRERRAGRVRPAAARARAAERPPARCLAASSSRTAARSRCA